MTMFTHPKDAPEGHKWQTRDGRPVRILAWDVRSEQLPIIALLPAWDDGDEYPASYTIGGSFDICEHRTNSGMDLIDAPRTRTVWVNVYEGTSRAVMHLYRDHADNSATAGRTACLEITYTDGEGL